jgi:4-hydroxy-4-methyl-2-oxoglutarate aldolase
MIEDPPLMRIRRGFERPPQALVDAFRNALTGPVVDAMGGSGALSHLIKPLDSSTASFCGVALTCDAGPADNLALFGALDVAEQGDIVMAAAGGHLGCAVTGDLLLGMAKNCGVAGFVTDGAVRDVAGIVGLGLPVFCAGVSPNSPVRNGPASVGLPVVIGGVAVSSGDIVVGDADGVVVVPLARAAATLKALATVRTAEAALEAKVKAGLRLPDFIRTLFEQGRIEEL